MVRLYFNPDKLARTMTRAQWKEAYRWSRKVSKRLDFELAKRIAYFVEFGSTWPEGARADFLDQAVNPPLLLGPGMM